MSDPSKLFEVIISEKLSAITFTLDCWQLQFDGPTINALSRLEVCAEGIALLDGHDQFRNLICGQIGKIVTAVELVQPEAFIITFSDQSSIRISLRRADCRGPEAMVFDGHNLSPIIVFREDG